MDLSNLRQIKEQQAQKELDSKKHTELKVANLDLQQTIVKSFAMLVDYLDGKVSKTLVVNQLKEIATPDALKVVEAVNSLHDTLKTHENTDLTEVTEVLKSILDEAKTLPKDLTIPEQKFVDYSDQLDKLHSAVTSLESVVKEKDLSVTVQEREQETPVVNVEAPDLEPLKKEISNVVKSVKGLVFPEYKTDNKEVEKLLKKSNKLLTDLLDKPMGGGGGGGLATPYTENGMPVFPELINGAIQVGAVVNTDNATGDAFSRLRVSNPEYVFDTNFQYDLQPLVFEQVTSGGATITHDDTNRNALMTLANQTGNAYMQTYEHFRYQSGRSQLILNTFNFIEGVANVKKFVGYSDGSNGIQFELNGTTKQITLYSDTAKGDETVTQANWNIDKLDGTGTSGITLDITKTHIFVIDFQWLGVGRVRCGFDIAGVIVYVHEFVHANHQTVAYMQTANLPVRAGMTSSANSTTTMRYICTSVISEGGKEDVGGYNFSQEGTATAGNGTRTHALSIRPKTTFETITNRSKIVLNAVDVLATGNFPIKWELCLGQAISGTTTYTDVNTTYSGVEFNTAGTISGNPTIVIASGYVATSAGSKGTIESQTANKYPITLDAAGLQRAMGTLTVLVTAYGGTSACRVSLDWKEIR